MSAVLTIIKSAFAAMLPRWRIWVVIISAATIICAASYYRMQAINLRRENAMLESSIAAADAKAASNAAAVVAQRMAYDDTIAQLEASASCEAERAQKIIKIKNEVSHAEDAPAAPVLRDALDQLREARKPAGNPAAH